MLRADCELAAKKESEEDEMASDKDNCSWVETALVAASADGSCMMMVLGVPSSSILDRVGIEGAEESLEAIKKSEWLSVTEAPRSRAPRAAEYP